MHRIAWICGCLLLASCSLHPVLEVDAGSGGTDGGGTGGGGLAGAGGQAGAQPDASGHAGAGGAGGTACAQLESDYSAALTEAEKCDATQTNQCQSVVSISLSCPGCTTHVNDTSKLTEIETKYEQAGCNANPHPCPAIACVFPGTGACVATNSGDVFQ